MPAAEVLEPTISRVPPFTEVVDGSNLRMAFQTIVDLASGGPAGHEALARYQTDTIFSRPVHLFEWAKRCGRVHELTLACLRQAVRYGSSLDGDLFINIHPEALLSRELVTTTVETCRSAGTDPSRIVLEITEQESIRDASPAIDTAEALSEHGVRIAFDDVGIAYSHLTLIDRIRPSFLKISSDFGTDFERDATKTKIVRNILLLAHDFDCRLVLEGIESGETARAAADLGIELGQGYHFGRPELRDAK